MSERVTQSELARLLGINRVVIHGYVNKGILELGDDGLLDFDAAAKALQADGTLGSRPQKDERAVTPLMDRIINGDAAQAEPDDSDAGDPDADTMPTSYQKARALKEKYAALREKTKHEVEQGHLIETAAVQRGIANLLAALVNTLERVPDLAAAELPDPFRHATGLRIRAEIDRALADAKAGLQRLLPETTP